MRDENKSQPDGCSDNTVHGIDADDATPMSDALDSIYRIRDCQDVRDMPDTNSGQITISEHSKAPHESTPS